MDPSSVDLEALTQYLKDAILSYLRCLALFSYSFTGICPRTSESNGIFAYNKLIVNNTLVVFTVRLEEQQLHLLERKSPFRLFHVCRRIRVPVRVPLTTE